MTESISKLLRDEPRRLREFPICDGKVFLAHAGVSPLPRRVADAMKEYVEGCVRNHQEDVLPEKVVSETRALVARLIDATAAEIAFVGSTSMGLAMVASRFAMGARRQCSRCATAMITRPMSIHGWIWRGGAWKRDLLR